MCYSNGTEHSPVAEQARRRSRSATTAAPEPRAMPLTAARSCARWTCGSIAQREAVSAPPATTDDALDIQSFGSNGTCTHAAHL